MMWKFFSKPECKTEKVVPYVPSEQLLFVKRLFEEHPDYEIKLQYYSFDNVEILFDDNIKIICSSNYDGTFRVGVYSNEPSGFIYWDIPSDAVDFVNKKCVDNFRLSLKEQYNLRQEAKNNQLQSIRDKYLKGK